MGEYLVHVSAHVGRQLAQGCDAAFDLLARCCGRGGVEGGYVDAKGCEAHASSVSCFVGSLR